MNYSLPGDQALVFYGNISEFKNASWLAVLSEKEIARAEQHLVPSDKHRYIISRAILKRLLSRFSEIDEKEIEFNYGKNGKPILCGNPELQFNISHSGEAFVIGVARKEIGIDVESLHRAPNISALESFLFTSAELKLFHNMHHSEQHETFIHSWTRKEAILKASGDGLTKAMNTLDVSFIEDGHFPLETTGEFPGNKADWFLESYTLMDHYRGAVAVKGRMNGVQYIAVNETTL